MVGDRQAALSSGVSYLAGFADYVHDLAVPDPIRAVSRRRLGLTIRQSRIQRVSRVGGELRIARCMPLDFDPCREYEEPPLKYARLRAVFR